MKDEPAYPTIVEIETSTELQRVGGDPGLTKREYFAAMAMQGILANEGYCGSVAEISVNVADALINRLTEGSSE